MTNPSLFQYIGCFSLGLHFNDPFGIISNNILVPAYDNHLKTMNNRLFYIGCGTEDFVYKGVQTLRKKLDEYNFTNVYNGNSKSTCNTLGLYWIPENSRSHKI